MKLAKKHIGRTVAYRGFNRAENTIQQGKLTGIRNGIAEIISSVVRDDDGHQEHNPTGFRTLLEVNHPHIVGVA